MTYPPPRNLYPRDFNKDGKWGKAKNGKETSKRKIKSACEPPAVDRSIAGEYVKEERVDEGGRILVSRDDHTAECS